MTIKEYIEKKKVNDPVLATLKPEELLALILEFLLLRAGNA